MSVISKSVKIKASPAHVFSVVTNPDNWTRYVTSLVAVKNMSSDIPAKGSTFTWEYKMMGLKFGGKGQVSESVKNKRFGLMLKGKATVIEGYDFIDNGDGTTTLDIKIDYQMPGAFAEALMSTKLVEKLNNLESKAVLDKIKLMCEA